MVVAVEQLELHLGVLLLEPHHHGRQPVGGHAGERAYPHLARRQRVQLLRRLVQQPLLRHDGADVGHEALTLRRQPCAGAGALQERQTQLRFHRSHNVADTGLGEAQLLRRLGQRRPLHDFFDNSILFCVHFVNLPLAFLNAWCYDTPMYSKSL